MEQALNLIDTNKEHPSDEYFTIQIRLQILAQKALSLRDPDETTTYPSTTSNTTPSATTMYLKLLHNQLTDLQSTIPLHLPHRGKPPIPSLPHSRIPTNHRQPPSHYRPPPPPNTLYLPPPTRNPPPHQLQHPSPFPHHSPLPANHPHPLPPSNQILAVNLPNPPSTNHHRIPLLHVVPTRPMHRAPKTSLHVRRPSMGSRHRAAGGGYARFAGVDGGEGGDG